jgi:hypothetical protein
MRNKTTAVLSTVQRFGSLPETDQRVAHISLVFREMWDTTAYPQNRSSPARASGQHQWYPISREKRARYPDFLQDAPSRAACATFFKESRMKFIGSTKLHRKFGFWGTWDPSLHGQSRGRSTRRLRPLSGNKAHFMPPQVGGAGGRLIRNNHFAR